MAVRSVYHVSIYHAYGKAPDHIPIASKTEKAGFTTEIAEYAEFFYFTHSICALSALAVRYPEICSSRANVFA